ncbi:MAG: transglycosylase domain-containing protein [Erysipelotrichaceae bacterium]|nr:transglycosylase domain-containing protein [Erysipelotrichaceae bacterium]
MSPKQTKKKKRLQNIKQKLHYAPIMPQKKGSSFPYFLLIFLFIMSIGILSFLYIIQTAPTLNIQDFQSSQSTLIYASNGSIITELGKEKRQNITYEQLPQTVIDAFLAIEDSRYFQHHGFDIPRFTQSTLQVLKSREFSQGGSTMTMQLIKNTYFSSEEKLAEKTILRKLQEIYLSIQAEKLLTKEEILVHYLNRINFGGPTRGIQSASQYYFQKDVTELSTSEAILLAGIINRPNVYNPFMNLDYATFRRNETIDMMYYHGYLTLEETLIQKRIPVEHLLVRNKQPYQYQAYIDYVVKEAKELTGKDPYLGNMIIHTSMIPQTQQLAEKILSNQTKIHLKENMESGFILLENETSHIIAIGGRRDYDGANLFSYATDARKQTGSAIKPILDYALALEYTHFHKNSFIGDYPIYWPHTDFQVYNADGKYHGYIPLQQALSASYNIPAILLLNEAENTIGREAIIDYLLTLGFDHPMALRYHLQYAIGGDTCTASPLQLANAFSMLINQGIYQKPTAITSITMLDTKQTYYNQTDSVHLLSKKTSRDMKSLLANNVTKDYWLHTLYRLQDNYPVYAKTGTSDWGTAGRKWNIPDYAAKDQWTLAASPTYTIGVWVGFDQGKKNAYFKQADIRYSYPTKIANQMLDEIMK